MKKYLVLLMVMLLTLSTGVVFASELEVTSPGTGNSILELTVEATRFSVTVPMQLPIDVDSNGVVTVASATKIVNNSYGAVKVTGVDLTPVPGWTIVDFTTDMTKEKVGAKKLGFKLNGGETVGDVLTFNASNFPKLDGANSSNSDELDITYDAVLPAQKVAIVSGTKVADVIFTIGWDD